MTYSDRVFLGSCENMAQIPDGVVDVCVTSPPYFNQRDYEVEGQIGFEDTPDEYIAKMAGVMREVRRVLKPEGTAFVNLGDSYCSTDKWGGGGGNTGKHTVREDGTVPSWAVRRKLKPIDGIKPKDLMMMPHRVAIALQQDGWWVRDAIVWQKPNAMPSSVNDRCTPSYEMVFHLAKGRKYYADMESVKEPLSEGYAKAVENGSASADFTRENAVRMTQRREQNKVLKQDALGKQTYTGFNERWAANPTAGVNLRNVWTIATEPYPGEHFAVMPRELVRRCVLIGSPAGGLVLDPFMGSGTVAEVAIGCGRHYVGYELNPEYHKLIKDRLGLFGVA